MLVSGNFAPLFRAGLRKEFRDTWNQYKSIYPSYMKVSSTSSPEQRATTITGPNRLVERGEGEPITYETPKLGPLVVAVDKEFALGFMITKRMVEDDLYGKANQGAKWLAHSARMTYEYRAAGLLDDAFSGSLYQGYDGLSLCNTAHTLIGDGAGTSSNALATPMGISVTSLTAMMELFQNQVDHNGDPIIMWPDKIVMGNNAGEYNRVIQILNSNLEPFTANNQDNAVKKRMGSVEPIMNPFRTNRTSWFMVDSKYNDVQFQVRRAVSMDDTFDFETDNAKYKCSTRFVIWYYDWRGWAGSNAT
jgi:hypothetical protein